jgi:hypothetical protein
LWASISAANLYFLSSAQSLADPQIVFSAFIHDSRRYVIFTAENWEDFDVQCRFEAEVSYVDENGAKMGVRTITSSSAENPSGIIIQAKDTRFQQEAGKDLIMRSGGEWKIEELLQSKKACSENIQLIFPTYRYSGHVRNGLPYGPGKKTFDDGTSEVGEYRDGRRNGNFNIKKADGETFEGMYKDDVRDGPGKLLLKNGDRYVGRFSGNAFDGTGEYIWKNGDRYVGEYKNGVADGEGKKYESGSLKYEGSWHAGNFSGHGTWYTQDGSKHVGSFDRGMFNGKGIFYAANGNRTEGEWRANKREGYFAEYRKDGTIWKGHYKDNVVEKGGLSSGVKLTSAENALEVCNARPDKMYVAVASVANGKWFAKGWWGLAPNACARPSFGGDQRHAVYLFFTKDTRAKGGTIPTSDDRPKFCVDGRDGFELKSDDCSWHSDFRMQEFGRISWPSDQKSRKWTLQQ